jgi:hypothetical protein
MSELTVGQLRGLPVNNNVISVPTGHTLYAPGSVLQVVSATKTDTFSMSSTTFTDIPGMSLTITPKFVSSKIFVLLDLKLNANVNVVTNVATRLRRESTPIYIGDASEARTSVTFGGAVGSGAFTMQSGALFLDSPATTSATTYAVQISTTENGQSVFVNRSFSDSSASSRVRTASSITLMEIAQ